MTQFSKEYQPHPTAKVRGKDKRTLILDAIKKKSLIGLNKDSTIDEAEEAFFGHVAQRALDPNDDNSPMFTRLLADKGWASVKSTYELVNFEFNKEASVYEQAAQVIEAVSVGNIAPDIASNLISSISAMVKIQEVTELTQQLEEVKKHLGLTDE
jgi:hypothetical protein